jgi:LPXTG-site transpeptidase (sortase) family protein
MKGRTVGVAAGAVAVLAACLLLSLPRPAAPLAAVEENDGPRLMRVMPAGGGGVLGRDVTITLSFDRPMDLESLAAAVYFEPPVAFEVCGESECLVVPVNLLEPAREYTFRLRAGVAEDERGGEFTGELEVAFTTRGDRATLIIPAFSFQGDIVEGEDPQGLVGVIGNGVGHYPGTGRPGRGNFVLMAHASGQVDFPFNHLFDLGEGDAMTVAYGGREYLYAWREGRVVKDTEVWILDPTGHAVVTTFICCAEDGRPSPVFHPPYRYVVRADLAAATPLLSGADN